MQQTTSEKALRNFLVIDDHESVLSGTVEVLKRHYPESNFVVAINAESQT
jgi:DNA-binding NarL/FixJ family response regulator